MSAFEYQAIDVDGKTRKGLIEADTAKQARQQLRSMDLMPVEICEVTGSISQDNRGSRREKINVTTVALITRQLATLIGAGQPLESAYLTVSKQTPKGQVKRVLLAVRARVLEGHPLSDALAEFPRIFDTMYCASVLAGEQSGLLDLVMERLADYLEAKQATLRLFQEHRILLAVAQQAHQALPELPNVVLYKTAVPIKAVLERLGE